MKTRIPAPRSGIRKVGSSMEDAYTAPLDSKTVEKHSLQIVKGAGISLAGNIVGKVVNLLFNIIVGRALGASSYGIYALGESLLRMVRMLALLGLNKGGVLKLVSVYAGEKDVRRLKGVIIGALGLSFCSSAMLVVLLSFLAPWLALDIFHEPGLKVLLRILLVSLPFQVLLLMVAAVGQALRRMGYDAILRSFLLPAANLTGVAVTLWLGFGLDGMAWCIVGTIALSALASLIVLPRIVPGLFSQVAPVYSARALLSISLPVLLINLSAVTSSQSGRLILGAFVDSTEVGVYSAAYRIALSLQLVLLSFGIFPPIVADLYNRGKIKELRKSFSDVARWIFSVMFLLFLIVVLFPRELIGVFGSEFMGGWPILVVLSFSCLIGAFTGQVGPMLRMTGNQRLEAAIDIASLLLNLLFNLVLVQQFGALGVAVGTTLALSIKKASKVLALYVVLGIHPYDRQFLRPVIIGLLGLAAVWGLRSLDLMVPRAGEVFLEASVLIGIYVGLGVLFFSDEDRAVFKLVFARVQRRIGST